MLPLVSCLSVGNVSLSNGELEMKSRRLSRDLSICVAFIVGCLLPQSSSATPSTHVWAPSTDIQADGTLHLTSDIYTPSESDVSGSKPDTVTNVGLETGLWPIKDKLGVEFGFDHITGYGDLDNHPLYFNAKVGTPENALFEQSPALALGGFYFGTDRDKTDQDIYYLKGAKTVSLGDFPLGRLSVGWFWGNQDLLLDDEGNSDANGLLLAWERTLSEVSDNLTLCVDYQGSESGAGALAPGISYKLADNVSMIFGYVIPNNPDLAETFTVQVDVDFNALNN